MTALSLRFIKLSNVCINASRIVSIEKNPDSFRIIMGHQELSALMFMGSGHVSSELCEYLIHRRDLHDFKAVEEFIKNI